MNATSAVLAAAAAVLFTAGITGAPGTATAEESEAKIHCEGVNACKGQADCSTASHDCAGKNTCKGKGWKEMTAAECEKAKKAMCES
jgi:hypothetical protein